MRRAAPLLLLLALLAGCGGGAPSAEAPPSLGGGFVEVGATPYAPGKVLKALNGKWKNAESFTYQWQRCTSTLSASCSNISSATSQSYTIVSADEGDRIRVGVTAHNTHGETGPSYSASVGPVETAGSSTLMIGTETVQTESGEGIVSSAVAYQFTPIKTGKVLKVGVYSATAATTAESVVVGIYSNVGERPGALLGVGTTSKPSVTAEWVEATIGTEVAIETSSKYWLVYRPVGGTLEVVLGSTGGPCKEETYEEGGTELPPSWPAEGAKLKTHTFCEAIRGLGH